MDRHGTFLKLFLKYQAGIKAFILSMVRDRDLADDILQETALVLWRKFDSFDPSRSFGAWARGIAANKIMQAWEQSRRTPVVFSPEAIQAVLDAYEKIETEPLLEKHALEQCMEELPGKSRHLLKLRYEKSLKLQKLAQELKSTLDGVNKALSRLRARLQNCIEKKLAAQTGDV